MKVAMAILGVRRPVRRPDPGPGRRRRGHQVPRRHASSSSPLTRSQPSTADAWIGLADRRPRSRSPASRSPTTATCAGPGSTAAAGRAPAAPPPLPAQQVVLRRAPSTRSSTGRLIAIGRFANAVFERVVVQGIVNGDRRRRPRAPASVVRGAAVRLRPRLRAAPGRRVRRPRPLLPDRELMALMLSVLLWLPVAVGAARASCCRGGPSGWARRARLARGARARDRPRRRLRRSAPPGSSTPSTRAGSRTSASATSSASTGSASSWSC